MAILLVLAGGLLAMDRWAGAGSDAQAGPATVRVPPAPASAGVHRFTELNPDRSPVGWNPCKPIPYWIGSKNLPGGGTDLVTWVLAEITAISGQHFEFKGYTATVPSAVGDNPVKGAWIGWTTEASTDAWVGHELDGNDPAIGLTASEHYLGGSRGVTRGWSMLLASYNAKADAQAGGVLRHELGHLLGLAHVLSTDEAMSPGGGGQTWGPGDRRGLWELGPGPRCNS